MRATVAMLALLWMLAAPARASDSASGWLGPHRGTAAFVGLGIVGTGAITVGTIHLLGQGGNAFVGFLALPASILLHYGMGRFLDVPVTWLSAIEGTVLGLATGAAGYALGRLAAQGLGTRGSLDEGGLAVIGLVVGGAIGTPLWTLLDPMGWAPAPPPGAGGDGPVFHAACDAGPR